MKNYKYLGIVLVFSIILVLNQCNPDSKNGNLSFRGVVLYPSDIKSVGVIKTIDILKDADLNLLGIHAEHRRENLDSLKAFITSKEGQLLLNECAGNNIFIEYELHALHEILNRNLFDEHPEYFRIDKNGVRNKDYNMCFTCEQAYDEIENSIIEITNWLKPTTHRYFFWTDDVKDAFCHCENCKNYSPGEQALIFENKLLQILQSADTLATLAHLAYGNTLTAPKKVIPSKGIFLEYAPISRDYSKPLSTEHVSNIKQNLEIFPVSTAHILEYWLDASMFSGWNMNNLTKVPWEKKNFERDIRFYNDLGIGSVTCFATWIINARYIENFGEEHTMKIIDQYGTSMKKNLN